MMIESRLPHDPAPRASLVLQEPPFFIVGSGRSGTTLMRSLLSSHSRLSVAPETHFLKSCIRLGGGHLERPPADFGAFWRAYCKTPRFASLGVTPQACEAYLPADFAAGGAIPFADVFRAMLRAFLDRSGKPRVGEKTPSHLHHADWLFRHFPEARIIAMRRDPRAMIASLLDTPWRKGEDDLWRPALVRGTRLHAVARDARRWAWVNGELLPRLERDGRVVAIRYEDLVCEPEATLRIATSHLGEHFEPAMLDTRADRGVDPRAAGMNADWAPWLRQHEASARRPVETGSLDKWRERLSAAEIAVIEAYAGEAMQRLGYGPLESGSLERHRARALSAAAEAACAAELGLRRSVRRVFGPAKARQ